MNITMIHLGLVDEGMFPIKHTHFKFWMPVVVRK